MMSSVPWVSTPTRFTRKVNGRRTISSSWPDPRKSWREVRASGHDVWYMNALNEGHGFRKKENRDLFGEIAVLFFKTHLLGEQSVSIR